MLAWRNDALGLRATSATFDEVGGTPAQRYLTEILERREQTRRRLNRMVTILRSEITMQRARGGRSPGTAARRADRSCVGRRRAAVAVHHAPRQGAANRRTQ